MNPLPPLTPFDSATMIESLDERGCGLRVAFFKPESASDRYGHLIATVQNAGQATEMVVARLLSYEGTGRDGWPASPPLQSLSIEQRPAGAVALLVGMSGQSHWSASVEAIPGKRELVFDVACRLGTGNQWRLGSMYLTKSQWQPSGSAIEFDLRESVLGKLMVDYGEDVRLTPSSGGFGLEATATSARPVRWKYAIISKPTATAHPA